jgi:hypothetical protein
MKKVFAVEIIEVLSPQEVEELRLFLESPYFNRGGQKKTLIQLFNLLCEAVADGEVEYLEKREIFEALFPGKQVLENRIDKLLTELKALIQTFLKTNHYFSAENVPQQLLDLTLVMRSFNLEMRYQQTFEKLKKQAGELGNSSVKNIYFNYSVALEEYHWQSIHNRFKGDLAIPGALEQLECFYHTQKTELLNQLLLQQRLVQLTPKAKELLEIPLEVPAEISSQNAPLEIGLEIRHLLTMQHPKIDGYYQLISKLNDRQTELSAESLTHYYTYLRNICINFINSGHQEFYEVLHEIHKDNLLRGYFYFQNKITSNAYFNITQIALRVGALEWAKDFVEQHKDQVIGENEFMCFYRMNKALCFFAEKKFEEALDLLPLDTNYFSYLLMARRLELMVYYELKSELLPYKINAFKIFLRRAGDKVLSESIYELSINFLNFLRQLCNTPDLKDKKRSAVLVKRITEKNSVAERRWLLEKAHEIGDRKKIYF